MSITTELREFVDGLACHKVTHDLLREIADHIDQEHEECVGFCRRLEDAAKEGAEVTIFGTDYIPLPKDADGETIHLGDVMEVINSKQRAKACYMQMGPSSTWAVGLTKNCHWYDTESLRHHEPTVEDVLDEFFGKANLPDGTQTRAEIIAEYAARLRLAGDE